MMSVHACIQLISDSLIIFLRIVSGNPSLYPGEDASFICKVNTSTIDNVMFQWTRFLSDGTSDTDNT